MSDPVRREDEETQCAKMLIELALLLPRGTNIAEHSVGRQLVRYVEAIRANTLAAAPVHCAASPADHWQPIETAPKDGTKILAYTIHDEIELTYWFTIEADRYDDVGDGLYRKRTEMVGEGWNGNCPTHWMPLPPAPAKEKS